MLAPAPHPFAGLTLGSYRVIYVDFPWAFSGGKKGRPQHYPRMSLTEIMALPIRELAHPEGCRLLLWITAPLLNRLQEILKALGFRYSTTRVWGKIWSSEAGMFVYADSLARGTGYEVVGNAEFLVIAKRGRPQKLGGKKPPSLFLSQRREHSRKPDFIRDEIVEFFDGPRCELFARSRHPGFDAWGNDVEKFGVAS